ncbi:hypothetical protein GCM10010170_077060 [Dactylosporangium salmoneum]|uniref:Uncharacterized protein n=1 Tax=Dactylosporangium salmoneum TaxID=53361 RepID=A0ABN3HAG3_9ACTN
MRRPAGDLAQVLRRGGQGGGQARRVLAQRLRAGGLGRLLRLGAQAGERVRAEVGGGALEAWA